MSQSRGQAAEDVHLPDIPEFTAQERMTMGQLPLHHHGLVLPEVGPADVQRPAEAQHLNGHPAVRHLKLVFTMFPGDAQVKMVMADTRKVYGTRAMLHRALIEEAKETLGAEKAPPVSPASPTLSASAVTKTWRSGTVSSSAGGR